VLVAESEGIICLLNFFRSCLCSVLDNWIALTRVTK
jgi:hypothetical protein